MPQVVLCPVCSGSGKRYEPSPYTSSGAGGFYFTCHGCGGQGWVEVGAKEGILESDEVRAQIKTPEG